jgi:hypothetical protein
MEYNYYIISTKRLHEIELYFLTLKKFKVEIMDIKAERISSHNILYIFKFISTEDTYKEILKELHIKERRQ